MKKRITVSLDEKLIEEARDTVVWMQAHGFYVTLSEFVAQAVSAKIEAGKISKGLKKIPKRKRELFKGRPLVS